MKRILAVTIGLLLCAGTVHAQTTEALLDSLQRTGFQYFWYEANPANGLIRDRSTAGSPASIAAVGFGLSSICVGIDHGWITRAQGRDRVLTTLQTFWNGPQGTGTTGTIGYKGLFYHFLDMNTATRTWTSELSTIDTALLLGGVLDVQLYFDQADAAETEIRTLADAIYRRADWVFMRSLSAGIYMGWKPETGFSGFPKWVGYNEAMILYILALGSPTFPVPASDWNAWTSGYQWQTHYNVSYVAFPPLFGHQYSHCWIDFRGIQDNYMRNRKITYFENSRRATMAQRAYCLANPGLWAGYSDSLWGLTASDDPQVGYQAHGAPPAQNDNGTITPTAAASSIAFLPDAAIPAIRNMYTTYHSQLWGRYGFKDAFNLTFNWWDTDYLGIDQGPIVMMIENYRNGSIWSRFTAHPSIQLGLQRANFLAYVGVEEPGARAAAMSLAPPAPNPFRSATTLTFRLASPAPIRLAVYDVHGREVETLASGMRGAGEHRVTLEARGLPVGVYFFRLDGPAGTRVQRTVLMR